jgi:hypothetical protein
MAIEDAVALRSPGVTVGIWRVILLAIGGLLVWQVWEVNQQLNRQNQLLETQHKVLVNTCRIQRMVIARPS